MPNLISPEDLYQPPSGQAMNSLGTSLRDAILYTKQAEQQQRQFDSLRELEQQRTNNAFDLGVGQLEGQKDSLRQEGVRDENTRVFQSGQIANNRIIADAAATTAEAQAKYQGALARGIDQDIKTSQAALLENTRRLEMTQRAEISKMVGTAAKNRGVTVQQYVDTPEGARFLDSVVSEYASISPLIQGMLQRDGKGEGTTAQIRGNGQGMYALFRVNPDTNEAAPVLDAEGDPVEMDRQGLASLFMDQSGTFDDVAARERQFAGSQETAQVASSPTGGPMSAESASSIVGGNAATALLNQGDPSVMARVNTDLNDPTRLNTIKARNAATIASGQQIDDAEIQRKMTASVGQTASRLFTEDGEKDFGLFTASGAGAENMSRDANIYSTAVLQRKAPAIARILGIDTNTPFSQWDQAAQSTAVELVIESQRGKEPQGPFASLLAKASKDLEKGAAMSSVVNYLIGEGVNTKDALPMPTPNELNAARKRMGI